MPKYEWPPIEVYNKTWERIEKHHNKEKIVVYISTKETKEMLLHTQRKMFRWLFTEIWNHLWEDAEQIKQNFLKWLFWTKTVKTGKLTFENAIKPTTSELEKEEAIFFIDSIMKFIEKYWVPCKYTPKAVQSLYNSYNN